jgi:hypothetical protein
MDLLLKNAQSVWISKHQARDIFIHLRRQCAYIHHAA